MRGDDATYRYESADSSRFGRRLQALTLPAAILLIWVGGGAPSRAAEDPAPSGPAVEPTAAATAPETTPPTEEAGYEGLTARMGPVTASFRFFGDVGAGYRSDVDDDEGAKSNFLAGSFDFFSSVRLSDHLQILSEIVAEFEPDTNEVGFELERLWAKWSQGDAFYAKLGREHAPVNHWNRRYHHGRIYWPAVTQPFLARFEDQGGPLPIHESGIELGGTLRSRLGAFGYTGVVSNGRGFSTEEVTNVQDHNDSKAWDLGASFSPAALSGLQIGGNYRQDRIPGDPATPGAEDADEKIVSVFGELRAGHWESIAEAATIDHDAGSSGPEFEHRSAYLQVNYSFEHSGLYGRVDARHMDQGDPFYVPGNLDLDRWDGLLGVRYDLGEQAAIKLEAGYGRAERRDALGVVTKDDVQFAELGVQWVF